MSIKAYLFTNQRLEFKDSFKLVHSFLESRLSYQNIEFEFFSDRERALKKMSEEGQKFEFCLLHSCMNPWLDLELVHRAIERFIGHPDSKIISEGHIPGTQFEFIIKGSSAQLVQSETSLQTISVNSDTQARFNNQLNLFKFKRLKMFLALTEAMPDAHQKNISALMELLSSKTWRDRLVMYFENGKVKTYSDCPNCSGPLKALPPVNSQPLIGYIPGHISAYYQCVDCGLGLQSPSLCSSDLPKFYDEFDYQDFSASHTNPEAFTPNKVRTNFSDFIELMPKDSVALDLGGVVGHFSRFLKQKYPSWQVVHSDFESKKNQHLESIGVVTKKVNFVADEIGHAAYDLITAWEVVEHLAFEDVFPVFEKINRALKVGGFFVFSTPDFDSPKCKAFDFYNVAMPFHPLILSKSWINEFVTTKLPEFKIHNVKSCSDFVDDWAMWSQYLKQTSPSFQGKAMVQVLDSIFKSNHGPAVKEHLLSDGAGTEVIFTLQKIR